MYDHTKLFFFFERGFCYLFFVGCEFPGPRDPVPASGVAGTTSMPSSLKSLNFLAPYGPRSFSYLEPRVTSHFQGSQGVLSTLAHSLFYKPGVFLAQTYRFHDHKPDIRESNISLGKKSFKIRDITRKHWPTQSRNQKPDQHLSATWSQVK